MATKFHLLQEVTWCLLWSQKNLSTSNKKKTWEQTTLELVQSHEELKQLLVLWATTLVTTPLPQNVYKATHFFEGISIIVDAYVDQITYLGGGQGGVGHLREDAPRSSSMSHRPKWKFSTLDKNNMKLQSCTIDLQLKWCMLLIEFWVVDSHWEGSHG